jgi:hypothetical protein
VKKFRNEPAVYRRLSTRGQNTLFDRKCLGGKYAFEKKSSPLFSALTALSSVWKRVIHFRQEDIISIFSFVTSTSRQWRGTLGIEQCHFTFRNQRTVYGVILRLHECL